MARNHVRHSQRKNWDRKRRADPKSPRHREKLRIFLLAEHSGSWLKRHAANWTGARLVANDFRMHGTGVFDSSGLRGGNVGFERHAAFRARPRAILAHLGVHRTNVDGKLW